VFPSVIWILNVSTRGLLLLWVLGIIYLLLYMYHYIIAAVSSNLIICHLRSYLILGDCVWPCGVSITLYYYKLLSNIVASPLLRTPTATAYSYNTDYNNITFAAERSDSGQWITENRLAKYEFVDLSFVKNVLLLFN